MRYLTLTLLLSACGVDSMATTRDATGDPDPVLDAGDGQVAPGYDAGPVDAGCDPDYESLCAEEAMLSLVDCEQSGALEDAGFMGYYCDAGECRVCYLAALVSCCP